MNKHFILSTFTTLLFQLCHPHGIDAQWQAAPAPGSVGVNYVQKIGSRLEAVTTAGAFYSDDDGLVWQKRTNTPGTSIRYQNSVYYTYSSANVEFYKSTDLGATWESIAANSGFLGVSITDFTVLNDTIFATDTYKVWRNNPGSNDWTVVYENIQFGDLRLSNEDGYVWLVKKQILRSSDQGSSWQNVTPAGINVRSTAIHGDTIMASPQSRAGAYFSADNGQTWSSRGNPPNGILHFSDGVYTLVSGYNVYLSKDEGFTWQKVYDYPYTANTAVFSNGTILLGMPNGLLRSIDDGENYLYSNANLVSTQGLPSSYLHPVGSMIAFEPRTHLSFDKGSHWFTPFLPGGIDDLEQKADTMYILSAYHKLLHRSYNSISAWDTVSLQSIPGTPEHLAAGSDALYLVTINTSSREVYRSTDGGLSWELQGVIPVLIIDFVAQDSVLFSLTPDGDIYVSSDRGAIWNLKNNGIDYPINDIFISENFAYAYRYNTYQGVFYVSNDYGENWTVLPVTIDRSVSYFALGNRVFVGDLKGNVYFIDGPNDSWHLIRDNLPADDIKESAIGVQDQTLLFVDTKLNRLFRRDLSTLSGTVVGGLVFNDVNQNGIRDTQESGLPYYVAGAATAESFCHSGVNGAFQLTTGILPDTLRIYPPSPYAQVTPAFHIVSAAADTQYHFAVTLTPDITDLQTDLSLNGVLLPGFTTEYVLTVQNVGTDTVQVVPKLLLDPALSIIETVPTFDQITADTIFWPTTSFPPQILKRYRVRTKLSPDVPIGSLMKSSAYAFTDTPDIVPDNNIFYRTDTVYAAFDPNFKESDPAAWLFPNDIATNRPIYYTIHFQNTGNYPASIVIVADTLSEQFDPATFHLISASHPVRAELSGGGILRFVFDNINLPDSARDEAGSHGFVKFFIHPKPGLIVGDSIDNQAFIYFDYNPAVVTNRNVIRVTQALTVQNAENLLPLHLTTSPNPFRDILRVGIKEAPCTLWHICLMNMTGQVVRRVQADGSEGILNGVGLPPGIYFIEAFTAKGRVLGFAKVTKI